MMAESTTENKKSLSFKNVIGLVKVNPGFACSKIIIRPSDKTAVLAGKGKLTYNSGEPKIDFSESDEKSYIITLEGNIEANKDYYIAVPAATLNEKWSITFVSSDDKVYIRQSDRSITFERKKVIDLGTFKTEGTPWVRGERGIVDPNDEIDLGLQINIDGTNYKVIFAKSNLTALGLAGNETDFGDYFAWGATEPWCTTYERTVTSGSVTVTPITWKDDKHKTYNWSTVPYKDPTEEKCIEYTNDGDELNVTKDDAARLILGGNWQIPTEDIWSTLHTTSNFDWNWTTQDEYSGFQVTRNNDNTKTIFLPAGGRFSDITCGYVGYGNYLSSTAISDIKSYSLDFKENNINVAYQITRSYGLSIRPVRLVKENQP